jgi:hypothetical protein
MMLPALTTSPAEGFHAQAFANAVAARCGRFLDLSYVP